MLIRLYNNYDQAHTTADVTILVNNWYAYYFFCFQLKKDNTMIVFTRFELLIRRSLDGEETQAIPRD
jgi:hypothetical protein